MTASVSPRLLRLAGIAFAVLAGLNAAALVGTVIVRPESCAGVRVQVLPTKAPALNTVPDGMDAMSILMVDRLSEPSVSVSIAAILSGY